MSQAPRRARDLGIVPGRLAPGPLNAITDVPGIAVGHATVDDDADVHTGVTAIVPAQLGADRRTLPCGLFVGNGHGKLIGATEIVELGVIETPILLTSTLSAFRVADALVSYVLELPGYEAVRTLNPVVGETNDGYLSDIRARPITADHVHSALANATRDRPAEGCVGAGTGTSALGYKAGVGTSSRLVEGATVGVLVQSNFSGELRVLGVPMPVAELLAGTGPEDDSRPDGNSCMIVVATDAPLDARQLGRVARRAVFAMARVGSDFSGGSGDYALAISTAEDTAPLLPERRLDAVFAAVQDAVEEALLNSLLMATTTAGHRGTRHALPHAAALTRLRAAQVLTSAGRPTGDAGVVEPQGGAQG